MGLLDRLFGRDRTLRDAEFAGVQYPDDPEALERVVGELFEAADGLAAAARVRGLVAPFGDYDYAGPLMAEAYASVDAERDGIERVLVMASSSRVPFRGVAVAGWDALETPIGEVPVDLDAVEEAVDRELARPVRAAFEPAAGLELQFPFLRAALEGIPCIPALVGDADDETVADFLRHFWDDRTLLVVGATLSEGIEAARAEELDAETLAAIEALRPDDIERDRTSARRALRALVDVSDERDLAVETVARATSAETAGTPEQVVGYGALCVLEG